MRRLKPPRVGHRKLSTLAVLLQSALRRTGAKTPADLQPFACGATPEQVQAACAELVNAGVARFDSESGLYSDHSQ